MLLLLSGANLRTQAYDIWVGAGQSNSVGFSGSIDATLDATQFNIIEYNHSDAFTIANEPLDHPGLPRPLDYPDTIGHQLTFAKRYATNTLSAGRKVLIIPAADGGSGFDHATASESWNIGGIRAQFVVDQVNEVLALNNNNVFRGIIWHQGEANRAMTKYEYADRLDELYYWFKDNINETADWDFIVGGLSEDWLDNGGDNRLQIQNALEDVGYRLPTGGYASSSGLAGGVGGEDVHFTPASQRTFGERYETEQRTKDYGLVFAEDWINNGTAGADTQLSCARSGDAFAFDSNGILQPVAVNTLRRSYDIDGTSRGLLIEEASENFQLADSYRTFTDSDWTKSNITVSQTVDGIDGSPNGAARLTATSTNGFILYNQNGTQPDGAGTYTGSLYIKRVTGSGNINISCDGGSNYTEISGSLTSDWQRFEVQAGSGQTDPNIVVRIDTSGDAIDVDWTQLEKKDAATSPMEGGATRNADVVTVATSGITGFSNTDVTLFVEWDSHIGGTYAAAMLDVPSGTNLAGIRSVSDFVRGTIIDNNSTQMDQTGGSLSTDTTYRGILTYSTSKTAHGQANYAFNGTAGTEDTAITVPSWTQLSVGSVTNSGGTPINFLNGHIRRVFMYNKHYGDAVIEHITSAT